MPAGVALGQTQPVKVVYACYRDTLEQVALKLMGKKMYAAQLLYGDEVGGAIVESDDGSFLTELARAALDKTRLDDLNALFASENRCEADRTMSEAEAHPVGAPAAAAISAAAPARGVSWDDLRRRAADSDGGRRRPATRSKPGVAAQGKAFGEALVQLSQFGE